MYSLAGSCVNCVRPLRSVTRRVLPIQAEASVDIPGSFEASLSQACQAVGVNLFGSKGKRRGRGLKRLIVEIPILDTGIENALFLSTRLLAALEGDGYRDSASVLYSDTGIYEAACDAFQSNTVGQLDNVRRRKLTSRLLIFNPKNENERQVVSLLDDVWRGDVVVLFNPEFSDEFKKEESDFLNAFDTVYCFQPLEIKVFFSSRRADYGCFIPVLIPCLGKNGALFRWQKEKGLDAKWLIFIEENGSFQQIGQQALRPTQEELELAMYNATAAESPITKGFEFLKSMGKRN